MLTPLVISTWQKLSTRLVALLFGSLCIALLGIGSTLFVAWRLEGGGAAINIAGTLRMQSYRLGVLLSAGSPASAPPERKALVRARVAQLDNTLSVLQKGDPQRPLMLAPAGPIRAGLEQVDAEWRRVLRPQILATVAGEPGSANQASLETGIAGIVDKADRLVGLIEKDGEAQGMWLRNLQLVLLAVTLLGAVAIFYLSFKMIIAPVERLQSAIERMRKQDFSVRLPVDSKDEFGRLAEDFNVMADRLHELYGNLEQLVEAKTIALESRDLEMALLFDSAAFLQQPQSAQELCAGFLERLRSFFKAEGGSVRVLDPTRGILHMVVRQGITPQPLAPSDCLELADAACGDTAREDDAPLPDQRPSPDVDQNDGYSSVAVFNICAQRQHLGFFNLHFPTAKVFSPGHTVLLDTLGQLLGTAIESQRLAEREREMAISEERNLVAQGLHDSIAQSLNFLNLQVQMLEQSLTLRQYDDVGSIVPALRAGVEESYQDVRELLQNYRTRLQEGNFVQSLEVAVEKFRRQTGIHIELQADTDGAPFPRDHQLQLLFILQEALSNIRKHAAASQVHVRLRDDHDFLLSIDDDGKGFDPTLISTDDDNHIGIHIMGERARRMDAVLTVDSAPGGGTRVKLLLGRSQRRAI